MLAADGMGYQTGAMGLKPKKKRGKKPTDENGEPIQVQNPETRNPKPEIPKCKTLNPGEADG
jgi:hypothetical protein